MKFNLLILIGPVLELWPQAYGIFQQEPLEENQCRQPFFYEIKTMHIFLSVTNDLNLEPPSFLTCVSRLHQSLVIWTAPAPWLPQTLVTSEDCQLHQLPY